MGFASSIRMNVAAQIIALASSTLGVIAAAAESNLPSCPSFASESSWDNCEGTKTFATGGKYVGEFRDGQLNGRGKHIYSNGSSYVGEFRDGNFNGQGILSYVNGDKYVGQFADGKPNGSGTLEYANGTSGASDVSIPADIVLTLMRTNTITVDDFMGSKTYVLADGSKVPSQQFRIRSLKVGNSIVQNVTASVASAKASILLGQSFLSRFKTWSVDNEQHTLVLR